MNNTIWLEEPACDWKQGLPVGNGNLGAMLFGGIKREKILLNHEWLWRGKGKERTVEPKAQYLDAVRKLFFQGKLLQGSVLANEFFGGDGGILRGIKENRVDSYQPAGYLNIDFRGYENTALYRRELNLRDGIASVSFKDKDECHVGRKLIAHASLPIIALHMETKNKEGFNAKLYFEREKDSECTLNFWRKGKTFGFNGQFVEDVRFSVEARISFIDGQTVYEEDENAHGISLVNTREVVILLAIATSNSCMYPDVQARSILDEIKGSWRELEETHTKVFRSYYDRVMLDIGVGRDNVPTDKRIKDLVAGTPDDGLIELYFNYARYLMISASRPGGLPNTMQGKWNGELKPPWECGYHHNINLEMNYWMTEPCNLPECTEALFDYIESYIPHGRIAAKLLYGCRGVYLPFESDPWGRATPESRGCAVWTCAAAWLSQHMWLRYEYSGDNEFLKKRAYPFMKEVAEFYETYLVRDSQNRLVTVPSQSSENTFEGGYSPVSLCIGATMDFELIHDVLTHAIESSKILGIDDDLRTKWEGILDEIPPLQIGRHGQLQEWLEDYEQGDIKDWHISHLFALYPGDQITLEETPELAQAARVTIKDVYLKKDRTQTYPSNVWRGWRVALMTCRLARLREAEEAYDRLKYLVTAPENYKRPNLSKTFHIDVISGGTAAIMGGAAAVVEMLMQSHNGTIRLLPAAPAAWREGSFKGLRARGGFTLDMNWKDGRVEQIKLKSHLGRDCRMIFSGAANSKIICEGNIVEAEMTGEHGIMFSTATGKTYEIINGGKNQ